MEEEMKSIPFAFAGVMSLAMAASADLANADTYPSQPIHILVGFTPGAGTDLSARIFADVLSERTGQQVVVENRPGAAGTMATDSVAKSDPDGYTLIWMEGSAATIHPLLNPQLPYGPDDFTYIGKFADTGMSYVISANLPATNMAEFVDYAQANPGRVRFGTPGIGGVVHLATELLAMNAGIEMTHLPYGGVSAALADLLGGHIELVLATPSAIAGHRDSDALHIIGISATERHPSLPDVPTVIELDMPGAAATAWYGLAGPQGLPDEVRDFLLEEFATISADPAVKERIEGINLRMVGTYGEAFEQEVANERAQWKTIIDTAGIELE
jgi:tripartite-type tricarboxylate transporter receptor subunit TctC